MKIFFSIFKNAGLALAGGYLLAFFQIEMGSSFLNDYLLNNLVTILVALFAVNSATLGVVLTRLSQILDENAAANFDSTKCEMRISLFEQIVLIFLSVFVVIINDSPLVNELSANAVVFLNTCLCGVFIYAVMVTFDIANSIFVMLSYRNSRSP